MRGSSPTVPLLTGPRALPLPDFVVAKVTPTLQTDLGYKLFFMFGTINIGGMAVFSLCVPYPFAFRCVEDCG